MGKKLPASAGSFLLPREFGNLTLRELGVALSEIIAHDPLALQPSMVDRKSYNFSWKVVPIVLVFLFFAYRQAERAAIERDTARRQETTYGQILDCEYGGKGGKYCHYSFNTADEEFYVGASLTSSDVVMGQTVDVYYDTQNPRVNALESFSIRSRDDQNWAYICLLIPMASIGVGFYAKARSRSDRQTL